MEISPPSELFDHLTRRDSLWRGWERALRSRGAPGGDGMTIEAFSRNVEAELARLAGELRSGAFRPGPVRRAAIPKRSGGSRILSILCVRDRVVQGALLDLIMPLAEREMEDASFGYRPGRSVHMAVVRVAALRDQGFTHVVDADITRFFDNVPHAPVLECFQELVRDARLTALMALFLAQQSGGRGLPQGAPMSPLMANLYLDIIDERLEGRGVRIVRFADDFVLLCKTERGARAALAESRALLAELGLELHPEKTRLVDFERGFRFLGKLFVRSLVMDATPETPAPASFPGGAPTPGLAVRSLETESIRAQAWTGSDDDPPFDDAPLDRPSGRSAIVRPLYVYGRGRRLGIRGEAFVVEEDGAVLFQGTRAVVDRIEIGPEAEADAEALRFALSVDVPVAFVNGHGVAQGMLWSAESRGALHAAQSAALHDPSRRLAIAMSLVDARIRNQRALLSRLNRSRKDEHITTAIKTLGRLLKKLADTTNVDTARGMEGEAATHYWPALGRTLKPDYAFTTRDRRERTHPAGLTLDLAAHLLTRDVEAIAGRRGLHLGLGFLHAPRDAPGPLAWDVMEIFRAPLAEGLVVYAFNNRVLDADDFAQGDDRSFTWFAEGRDRLIRTYEAWIARPVRDPRSGDTRSWRGLIESEVDALARHLEDAAPYAPYVMDY